MVAGKGLAIALAAIALNATAQAGDLSARLRLSVDNGHADSGGLYGVPDAVLPAPAAGSEQNLEIDWRHQGVNATATLRNRAARGDQPEQEAFFNELYVDTRVGGQDISLGRKITSWGVGFGFRPLDVVQQENRRALYTNTLRGVDQARLEWFGMTAAVSLVWSNPGKGRENAPEREESLALKVFDSGERGDLHAVARYSDRSGAQLGLGLSQVVGESLEWHASALWQEKFSQRVNRLTLTGDASSSSPPLSAENPFIEQPGHGALKALAGASWTHASGWGLLGEVWYDETAYTNAQWQALNRLTRRQRALLASGQAPASAAFGNIAWNRQAFLANNLRQWNALLRVSRQNGAFDPALEILYTPEDRGWVATASGVYKLDRQRIEAGLRYFGGDSDSSWALLPGQWQAFISWEGAF